MERCENCNRTIGKLETPHVHDGHVVCGECAARLAPERITEADLEPERVLAYATPGRADPPDEYRALGLNSRGLAWGVWLAGLLLSPLIIGIPLLIWGMVADWMLYKHKCSLNRSARP